MILRTSSLGVRYALYSLASSKPETGGTMPKVCATFLSQPGSRDIKLYPTGDVSLKWFHILLDNSLLFKKKVIFFHLLQYHISQESITVYYIFALFCSVIV